MKYLALFRCPLQYVLRTWHQPCCGKGSATHDLGKFEVQFVRYHHKEHTVEVWSHSVLILANSSKFQRQVILRYISSSYHAVPKCREHEFGEV
jgi:hypothetical protein